ncbi:MAG: SUMF1/EgtB/PvdO family nonheme iron enzyme, partial [Anaerolineales bacterium]
MQKVTGGLFYLLILISLILSACSPDLTITLPPEENTPTPEPAPPEEEIAPEPSDTPETLEVSVADLLEAGTAMKWYDEGYLVFVPAGEVTLGDNQIENNQVYSATLDDYWIYMFPVTNSQYSQCVATGACTPPADEEPYPDIADPMVRDDPVVGVTWDQAGVYCQWMKGRLPTKAEWEKAARGPQASTYPWGEGDPTCDLLNFDECEKLDVSLVYEYPEGRSYYQAFDLAGNTFEWVFDLYEDDIVSQLPGEEPYSPPNGTERVVRGSSYVSEEETLPSAELYYLEPDQYRTDLGFRCVIGEAEPEGYASPCVQTAFVAGLPAPWQPGPPIGESELPDLDENTCVPEKDLDWTYYCPDQANQTGGLDLTITPLPGGEAYLKSYSSNQGVYCAEGNNPIGCFGPEGAAVSFEICASCTPLPNWEIVKLSCDNGFSLTNTDPPTCVYQGGPPTPGG